MVNYCFISYSTADGLAYARRLTDNLQGRYPEIKVWLDKDRLVSGEDWDTQIASAIRDCKCLIFLMTEDSVTDNSVCKNEWTWALKYKKPIIPLHFAPNAERPFRLYNLQYIDFTRDFDAGLVTLHDRILFIDSPQGALEQLQHRHGDAIRDLRRASEEDKARIQADIENLKRQIEIQQKIVDDPQAAEEQTRQNIEAGLEGERNSVRSATVTRGIKFINPRPVTAPSYFQDRFVETRQIVDFLCDDSQRLMTIVGRGGVGKTAMICRLLKNLETGELPDQLGAMEVEGIVYLSENGHHRSSFANLFYDLSKLLDEETARQLDAVYKNPQSSAENKARALFDKFRQGCIVLLLDNFEPLVDPDSFAIRDRELDEALHAFLNGPGTCVKIVITSRTAPRQLNLVQPGRQRFLTLDEGLESPYAENILREMDRDGSLGLKIAPQDVLKCARERTRGYPRALEALVAILRLDRYTTLAELLEKPTPENVIQELVGEAFNRLDPGSQKVMQALAIYNRPVPPAAVDYLLAPYLPSIDSALILQRLVSDLLVRRESGRFYLHPVDRVYALGTIPEGNPLDILRSSSGREIYYAIQGFISQVPELFTDQEKFQQVAGSIGPDLLTDLANAIQTLDAELQGQVLTYSDSDDEFLLQSMDEGLELPRIWTQYCLTDSAANYFAETCKPQPWKDLEDLAPQLAEFDLRCDAGNYNKACYVLYDIEHDHLLMWGHYRMLIDLYLRLIDHLTDVELVVHCLNMLGWSFYSMGDFENAFRAYEAALQTAKEMEDPELEVQTLSNLGVAYRNMADIPNARKCYERHLELAEEEEEEVYEATGLANLGNAYADMGDLHKAMEAYLKALTLTNEGNQYLIGFIFDNIGHCCLELAQEQLAIDFHNQALIISQDLMDQRNEAINLENIGHALASLGDYADAEENYKEAIRIATEISASQIQNFALSGLAKIYLFHDQLNPAREVIEAALQFDIPKNNHSALLLYGCILLRQGEQDAARQGFEQAIVQADQVLARTSNYYTALYAKALALYGLALCIAQEGQSSLSSRGRIAEATDAFHQAYCIAPHAGVIRHNLQLFDELAKCDSEGVIRDVRPAVEGK
jgi:tetratricopeptide (TPR) repeat protein